MLHDLVEVRLQWTEDMHAFEFELPRCNDSVGPGDPDAACANRAASYLS